MDVKPAALLSGLVARPVAAEPLYRALSEVLTTTAQEQGAMSNSGALTVTSVSVATNIPVSSTDVLIPIGVRPSGKTGAGRELDAISTTVSIRPPSAAVTLSHDSADVPSEATFLGNGGVGGPLNNTNNIVNNSNNYINNNYNNEISTTSSSSSSSSSSGDSGKQEDPKKQKVQNPKAERSTGGADPLTIDSFLENLSADDDGDIDYIAAAAIGPAVTQISANEPSATNPAVKTTASSGGKTSEGSDLQTKSLYEEIRF
jgi:hypothetical protein